MRHGALKRLSLIFPEVGQMKQPTSRVLDESRRADIHSSTHEASKRKQLECHPLERFLEATENCRSSPTESNPIC